MTVHHAYSGPAELKLTGGGRFNLSKNTESITIQLEGNSRLLVHVPSSEIMYRDRGYWALLPNPITPEVGVMVALTDDRVLDKDYPVDILVARGILAYCWPDKWAHPMLVIPGDPSRIQYKDVWNSECPEALGIRSVSTYSKKYLRSFTLWDKSKKVERKDGDSQLPALSLMSLPDFKPRTIALAVGGQLVRSVADSLVASVIPAVKRQITDQLWSSLSVDRTLSSSIQFLDGFVDWYMDTAGDRFQHQFEAAGRGKFDIAPHAPPAGRVLWFFWNHRLYWATVVGREAYSGDLKAMTLCTYGRSNKPLVDFVKAVVAYYKDKTGVATTDSGVPLVQIHRLRTGAEWMHHSAPGRELNTVVYDDTVQVKLFDRIEWWLNNKAWYDKRGIAYKYTAMLHGVAGTGKTSLSKVLATMYKRSIYSINLSLIESDANLYDIFSAIPPKSIIVMDEVDSCNTVLSREAAMARSKMEDAEFEETGVVPPSLRTVRGSFNLSALLDIMDGLVPLSDMIILMTTNRLTDLDPALIREGRTDEIIEVMPVGDTQVRKYIKLVYPDADLLTYPDKFAPITGSHLQGLFYANPNDEKAFVDSIPKLSNVADEVK